jgi:hypothetical protein
MLPPVPNVHRQRFWRDLCAAHKKKCEAHHFYLVACRRRPGGFPVVGVVAWRMPAGLLGLCMCWGRQAGRVGMSERGTRVLFALVFHLGKVHSIKLCTCAVSALVHCVCSVIKSGSRVIYWLPMCNENRVCEYVSINQYSEAVSISFYSAFIQSPLLGVLVILHPSVITSSLFIPVFVLLKFFALI